MSLPLFHFYKHNITLNSKRKKKYPSLSLQNPPSIHQSKYLGSDSAENLTGTALIISSCSVYCFLFFHPQIFWLKSYLCVHVEQNQTCISVVIHISRYTLINKFVKIGKNSWNEVAISKLPIWKARPDNEEQPGPPVSQSIRGSFSGLFSDLMK